VQAPRVMKTAAGPQAWGVRGVAPGGGEVEGREAREAARHAPPLQEVPLQEAQGPLWPGRRAPATAGTPGRRP